MKAWKGLACAIGAGVLGVSGTQLLHLNSTGALLFGGGIGYIAAQVWLLWSDPQ